MPNLKQQYYHNKNLEELVITNNPGQGHTIFLSTKYHPSSEGHIFNMRGQEVAQVPVVKGSKGYYAVWNGETTNGFAPEGVYLYKQDFSKGIEYKPLFFKLLYFLWDII